MFVVKQVPVCNFILRCFEKGSERCMCIHYVGNTNLGFPECLLFLDSDKQLDQ